MNARMQSTHKRRKTVLTIVEEIMQLHPNLITFLPLNHTADLQRSRYNERTLARIAMYARETRWVKASTIQDYVSNLKVTVEHMHHGPILVREHGEQLRMLYLSWRREDGPTGERRASRGLRMSHLRLIIERLGRPTNRQELMCHCLRHVSHQGFLRGGEPGTVDGQPFDPRLHLTLGKKTIEWIPPAKPGDPPTVALYLLAIKDTAAKRKRLPTIIAKRSDDDKDLLCPYNALRDWQQVRRREMAQYSEQEREDAPLFTAVGPEAPYPFFPDEARQSEQERVVDAVRHGQWLYSDVAIMDAPGQQTPPDVQGTFSVGGTVDKVITTAWMRQFVADDCALLGLDPTEYFANAWRVGGASDLIDAPQHIASLTIEGATKLIKARGRWWTDIYDIYARWSMHQQASVSLALSAADGVAVEDAATGWRQPGRG